MLTSPIPSTTWAKNCGGYDQDSGLDIHVPSMTPCFAAADGFILYRELGHTPWPEKDGTRPYSCLIELAAPFELNGRTWRYLWYTHMLTVPEVIPDGGRVQIKAGSLVGHTGWANNVDHLHFGILSDRDQLWPDHCMPWRDIAHLIWDASPPAPQVSGPPTHERQVAAKVFYHGGMAQVIVDGTSYRLSALTINGENIVVKTSS